MPVPVLDGDTEVTSICPALIIGHRLYSAMRFSTVAQLINDRSPGPGDGGGIRINFPLFPLIIRNEGR
jgi:hypothetical protein